MYPLLNQAAHASRKIQHDVLHRQHPNTRRTERHKGEGKVQISKCERRDEAGNAEEEILRKASMTDRRLPGTVCTSGCSSHCVRGRRGKKAPARTNLAFQQPKTPVPPCCLLPEGPVHRVNADPDVVAIDPADPECGPNGALFNLRKCVKKLITR